jgi:hypothetical protein
MVRKENRFLRKVKISIARKKVEGICALLEDLFWETFESSFYF